MDIDEFALVQAIFSKVATNNATGLAADTADLLYKSIIKKDSPKDLKIDIQQHPLGFFCIKWKISELCELRLHIWNGNFGWTQSPNWPIHDHTFNFISHVLTGLIQNKIYYEFNSIDKNPWKIYKVSYSNSDSKSKLEPSSSNCNIKMISQCLHKPGDFYSMQHGVLHRSTLRSASAVSLLATTKLSHIQSIPRVVGDQTDLQVEYDRTIHTPLDVFTMAKYCIDLLSHC
jgi:hypothetical protein